MLKLAISITLVLGTFSQAIAANEVVVSCRGSLSENMGKSENYNIAITDFGDIVVEGEHKDSRRLELPILHEDQVVKNDRDGLHLIGAKKRLGMVLANKSIVVDYKTGRGVVTEYNTLDGAGKAKKIFLESCRR